MIQNVEAPRKNWPRWMVAPDGTRARVDCWGDVPLGWSLETPIDGMDLKKPPKAAKAKATE